MKNTLFKKGLVVGIIVLFVGVSVLSSVSSKDVSISNNLTEEDNNDMESGDSYIEIITKITGYADTMAVDGFAWYNNINKVYFLGKIQIWGDNFSIKGIRINTEAPLDFYFKENASYVETGFCIGYHTLESYGVGDIYATAYGNIEWE